LVSALDTLHQFVGEHQVSPIDCDEYQPEHPLPLCGADEPLRDVGSYLGQRLDQPRRPGGDVAERDLGRIRGRSRPKRT